MSIAESKALHCFTSGLYQGLYQRWVMSLQSSAIAGPRHRAAQPGGTGQRQARSEATLPSLYLRERRRSVPSRFSLMSSGERERGEMGGFMWVGRRESKRSLSKRCETGSCSISSWSVWLVLRIKSSTCNQTKGQDDSRQEEHKWQEIEETQQNAPQESE